MIHRLFLDTNVVMDLLAERKPFYESAAKIASLADTGRIKIFVSTLTFPVVYYLLSNFEHEAAVKQKLNKFKVITESSELTDQILEKGLMSEFADFEDALQYYCAINMKSNFLITRNEKDFKHSDIPVITPDEYLQIYKQHNK